MDVYQRAKSQIAEDRVLTSRLPGAKASAFLLLVRSEKSDIGSAKYFSNGQQVHVAHSMFLAPSANDQAECESETMVVDDSLKAVGRSQSLHSSDDRREPNPTRAKFRLSPRTQLP